MSEKEFKGPKLGPDGQTEVVVLWWRGDHSRCGRFYITETMIPKRAFPIDLFGRPSFGHQSVRLESAHEGGGYRDRAEARAWAGVVAFQLENGAEDAA